MARRRAARIDKNQPRIVEGLRRVGATVVPTHAQHDGFPDLVVGFRGVNYLMEIKDPDKPPSKRKLTPDQVEFFDSWQGQVAKVETLKDAYQLIGAVPFRDFRENAQVSNKSAQSGS